MKRWLAHSTVIAIVSAVSGVATTIAVAFLCYATNYDGLLLPIGVTLAVMALCSGALTSRMKS